MFLLCILTDENELDAMPVLKTTHYPWAGDSYRPLAYGRLAYIAGRGLLVDLQSFEHDPDIAPGNDLFAGSCVTVALAPDKDHSPLIIALDASDRHAAFLNGAPVALDLDVDTYSGEDEQGWYWGVRFYLDPAAAGLDTPRAGQSLRGTIYVTHGAAEGDRHMGGAAAMTTPSVFSPDNLGDISVIDY